MRTLPWLRLQLGLLHVAEWQSRATWKWSISISTSSKIPPSRYIFHMVTLCMPVWNNATSSLLKKSVTTGLSVGVADHGAARYITPIHLGQCHRYLENSNTMAEGLPSGATNKLYLLLFFVWNHHSINIFFSISLTLAYNQKEKKSNKRHPTMPTLKNKGN